MFESTIVSAQSIEKQNICIYSIEKNHKSIYKMALIRVLPNDLIMCIDKLVYIDADWLKHYSVTPWP